MLEQAFKDSLTGFYLRAALEPYLQKLIADFASTQKPFSVALIDIDRFKRYNDRQGHIFGDEILKYVASTFRLTFFEGQCALFRYGGDEFIAVFPEKTPKEAYGILRRCQRHLRYRPCLYKNRFYRVNISAGIAGFPEEGRDADELVRKADEAMYFSKRTGRNRASLYGRLKLLRFRRVAGFWLLVLLAASALVLAYRLSYQKFLHPALGQIRHMKIVTKPENLDEITLRSGRMFEGRIVSENARVVTLQLYFEGGGEGRMTFPRAEISWIKYAEKKEQGGP
ncbi:MAG: GGDEF domain-containing protein [Candidatus Omnitrophota bacterium]